MKTNIYSKFMPKNSVGKLYEILNDEGQIENMRLAAIWELQLREQAEEIPSGLESELEKIVNRRQENVELFISEEIPDEISIPNKIKWAANLIYIALGFQVLYYLILSKAFHLAEMPELFIFGFIIGIIINILIGYGVGKGINWLRIAVLVISLFYAVLFYFGISNMIMLIGRMTNLAYFQLSFTAAQIIFRILIIILLFNPEINRWYKSHKSHSKPDMLDQI